MTFNKAGGQNRGLQSKGPRDSGRYRWTHHVVRKMQYYGLTPSRVLRVIRAPQRVEEGVAEGTLAAMQTAGSKAKPWEIWVMWRDERPKGGSSSPRSKVQSQKLSAFDLRLSTCNNGFQLQRKIIITAWRYPGVSPVRERVPIPSDILAELELEGIL